MKLSNYEKERKKLKELLNLKSYESFIYNYGVKRKRGRIIGYYVETYLADEVDNEILKMLLKKGYWGLFDEEVVIGLIKLFFGLIWSKQDVIYAIDKNFNVREINIYRLNFLEAKSFIFGGKEWFLDKTEAEIYSKKLKKERKLEEERNKWYNRLFKKEYNDSNEFNNFYNIFFLKGGFYV